MATGASAYTRLRKPEDGLSQSIQYWGGVQQRNADRLQRGIISAQDRAEREKVRKAEEDKYFRERYGADPSKYATDSTGFSTLDDVNRDAASYLINEEIRLSEMANEARKSGNFDEAEKIRMRILKNRSNFKNYSEGMTKHEEILSNYQEASEKGKVSGYSKGFEDFYQEVLVNKNVVARPDKNGNLVYFATKRNKDGSTKVIDVPLQDVFSGKWRYYEKNNLDDLTAKWVGNIGSNKVKRPDGTFYTLESDQWGEKHDRTANTMIESRLASDEFVADMVDQYDLYDEEGIDSENPPMGHEFSDETKELVRQKLYDRVRGAYDETYSRNWDSGRAADSRARERMAREDDKKDSKISTLKYDAQRAVKDGDYTVLLGAFGDSDNQFTVTGVTPIDNGKKLLLTRKNDDPIEIPNTERAVIDFKVNNTESYSRVNTSDVLNAQPENYRGGSSIQGTPVGNFVDKFFDSKGKPKVDDEEIAKELENVLGLEVEDSFSWSGNSLKVNGKEINYKNKKDLVEKLEEVVGNTGENNLPGQPKQQQTEDPLGILGN